MEPTFNQDRIVEWKCKVCSKVCATEHELAIHKKRHKIDDPLICTYCQSLLSQSGQGDQNFKQDYE